MMTKNKWINGIAGIAVVGLLVGCAQTAPQANTTETPNIETKAADDGHGGHAHAIEGGHTHTTKLIFASQPETIQAGQSATWTLKIVDDIDNSPITEFDVVHDKMMHLIIVSKDLLWFNHLHPEHKGDGVFEIETVVPHAGDYKLYADYRPTEREGEVAQHDFKVEGENPRAALSDLTPDKMEGAWMIQNVRSGLEGEPDNLDGPAYQVALMPMPAKIEAGKDVMLHFQVRDESGKPVAKLEPYLGAQGHCVILSADANTYLHTHPMGDGEDHAEHGEAAANATTEGADVMFHTAFPTPGLYKVWGQFQHDGKIITAAFVLNVEESATGAATTDAHQH